MSAICAREYLGAERAVETDGDGLGVPAPSCQNASGNWPESSRPDLSVIVPDTITGTSMPAPFQEFADGVKRGLGVQGVEDASSTSKRSTPPSIRPHLVAIGLAKVVEGHGAVAGIGHIGQDGGSAVSRSKDTTTKHGLPCLRVAFFGGGPRQPGAFVGPNSSASSDMS